MEKELETIPMQISHAEMLADALTRAPGYQGPSSSMPFPAPRNLGRSDGSVSASELAQQSRGVLPGTGGSTVEAKASGGNEKVTRPELFGKDKS
jgi:hypothetical protein